MRYGVINFFGGKIFSTTSHCFVVKNIVRGNAVQIILNFPAKSLCFWTKFFLSNIVIKSIYFLYVLVNYYNYCNLISRLLDNNKV